MPVSNSDLVQPDSPSILVGEHRRRILGAFRSWTGDFAIAEDLAQETLFTAWQSNRRPSGEPELTSWIYGVARNIYLRHRRSEARSGRVLIDIPDDDAVFALASSTTDLDLLIEHDEIVSLLDSALAQIPPASRRALLLRYIEDLPQREIADRLGINEKALEGKLHRGKRALHRYLVTDGIEQSRLLGLIEADDEWQVTNLWCNGCGKQRLQGRWLIGGGFHLDCPSCALLGGERSCHSADFGASSHGLRSFGAAESRISAAVHAWSASGVGRDHVCPFCGSPVVVHRDETFLADVFDYWLDCPNCPGVFNSNPIGGASSHPTFRAWLKVEKRVVLDPNFRTIERNGRGTTHLRWSSRTSSSSFEALRDCETMRSVAVMLNGRIVSDNSG